MKFNCLCKLYVYILRRLKDVKFFMNLKKKNEMQ